MKIRNKVVIIALIVAMLFGTAACGSNQSGGQAPAPDTSNVSNDSNTSDTSSAASGSTIKIGYVAPFTGVNSDTTTSTKWANDLYLNQINNVNGGIEVDGKKLPVEIIYRDSQSDPSIASDVATQLVLEQNVDMLIGAWTPNTTVPVAAVAERYNIPCICPNSPAQAWKAGLPENTDYQWCAGIMFDLGAFIGEVVHLWDTIDFNKKVGLMLDNGTDGATIAGVIGGMAAAAGYTVVDPGRYPTDTNDYSAMINLFKQEDVSVIYGSMTTANYATFLKQCAQLSYTPILATGGLACHYDYTVETIDSIVGYDGAGQYVCCECFWCPEYGYGDDYLGMSAADLVAKWESDNGTQAPEDMGFSLACDYLIQAVFNQAGTVDKATVRDTLSKCTINSLFGKQVADGNVYFCPVTVVQWVKGDKYKYEPNIVSASTMPQVTTSPFVPYGTK